MEWIVINLLKVFTVEVLVGITFGIYLLIGIGFISLVVKVIEKYSPPTNER